ncbi:MAG: DUF6288 domain-containing protein [Verrucomicrobiaceae bacterium]
MKRLLSALLAITLSSLSAQNLPLGSLEGEAQAIAGSPLIKVVSVTSGGPADTAGIQPGDMIHAADGIAFTATSSSALDGYLGAVQQLAMAIDHAEGTDGLLTLDLIRSGTGNLSLTANLGTPGPLGPAWPAGSTKADATYQYCIDQINAKVVASSSADFGYTSGWFGIILLSHDDWATTYRPAIDKLRTRCQDYLNGREFEPLENYYSDGSQGQPTPGAISNGLENWDVTTSGIFLALYRSQTGDATADTIVQTAAEMIAHRVQHWVQVDDDKDDPVIGGRLGRMGHGGVDGDYSRNGGTGALNIINAHALPALALLRNAGANMSLNLGDSVNAFSYNPGLPQMTIEEKAYLCWEIMREGTRFDNGNDDGNVGYVGIQSGYDSTGRTGGSFAGWKLYGFPAPTADDTDRAQRQEDYLIRMWKRQQHAHAYTLGGIALSQMAMPFLSNTRGERFHQENSRMFAALCRKSDNSVSYIPGRQNNGGDSYLNYTNVALVNAAIPHAFRKGNLPGFPAPAADSRSLVWMKSPVNTWPALDARQVKVTGALTSTLDVVVTDEDGSLIAPANYTAQWTSTDGATFTSPTTTATDISFPGDGTFRATLEVTRNATTTTEPYDFIVKETPTVSNIPPSIVIQPTGGSLDQGESITLDFTTQGTAPLVYQWQRNGEDVGSSQTTPALTIENASAGSAGTYTCIVTNAYGVVTTNPVTISINGIGGFVVGGLWQDIFTDIAGSSVTDLTSSPKFPGTPDASGPLSLPESTPNYGGNYGQRWSGWITPDESGDYRFYLATDDASELYLSTTDKRADRVLIASENSWNGSRTWSSAETSANIPLVAGQRYFIELLHKEGGGGDNAAFTWAKANIIGIFIDPADDSLPLASPGAVLEYQVGGTLDDQATPPADYPPIADDQTLTVFGTTPLSFTLTGSDYENPAPTFSISQQPAHGTLSGTAPNLTYTPTGSPTEPDILKFRVNDGTQDSPEATVTFVRINESAANLIEWDGSESSRDWSTALNWVGDTAPTATQSALFHTASLVSSDTNLDADRTIKRLVVAAAPDPIDIGGTGVTLTLTEGVEMRSAARDVTSQVSLALAADQTFAIGDSRTLTLNSGLAGDHTLTKTGPGTLRINNVSSRTSPIIVSEGTLELGGGGWYQGYVGGRSTITVQAGATLININSHSFGSSNNANRDAIINGGSFLLDGGTYFDDFTLTAGHIGNTDGGSGNIRARSGSGTTITILESDHSSLIDCEFDLTGSAILDIADGTHANDLVISAAITGSNTLTKEGDGNLLLTATSSHSGTFSLDLGSMTVLGSLASNTTLAGGTVLDGTGTLASVINDGQILPGLNGPGVINITTLNHQAAGVIVCEIGGTSPGTQHDQLASTGTVTLNGALDIQLINSFIPAIGDSFTVLSANSRIGKFSTVNLPALPAGREWITTYSPSGLSLSVVATTAFHNWQKSHWPTDHGQPEIAGPLVDFDLDGLSNLTEYAIGFDPRLNSIPSGQSKPGVIEKDGANIFSYPKNPAATDVSYRILESDDLGQTDPWTLSPVAPTQATDGSGNITMEMPVTATEPHRFYRLEVTLTNP